MRRAHEYYSSTNLLLNLRKGEPKVELKTRLANRHSKMPTARSCHTLLVRQTAHCHPAPCSHIFPVFITPIQFANPFKEAESWIPDPF
jgi:hypothetical protein